MEVIAIGIRLLFKGFVLLLIVFVIGYIVFANAVRDSAARALADGRAEGIVVPTGGQDRIAEGVRLLAAGMAQRLLITGVHPSTTAEELEQMAPAGPEMFACCIDLDRRAQNTMDNATETRTWAERHGFSSLIVVTSSYHMPRTLAELERTMPGITLIPHAVVPRGYRFESWWSDPRTMRLLFFEYVKYIPALALLSATRIARQMSGDKAARAARMT